jgi:hypothetical protein
MTTDKINPSHYNDKDFIGHDCKDITQYLPFYSGSAIKYLWRVGRKDDIVTEIKKAGWYIREELARSDRAGFFGKLAIKLQYKYAAFMFRKVDLGHVARCLFDVRRDYMTYQSNQEIDNLIKALFDFIKTGKYEDIKLVHLNYKTCFKKG